MLHLTSILDLDRESVEALVARATQLAECAPRRFDGVVGLLFFESSTRTQMGFAAAAARMGLTAVVQQEQRSGERMSAAESLEDTVRVVSAYVDLIVLRHPNDDALHRAIAGARCPVVNAGAGSGEHPTQALADILTLHALHSRIDGLRVILAGDLRQMRTAHSLVLALALFDDVTLLCVAPTGFQLPSQYVDAFAKSGNRLELTDDLDVSDADVVYLAGFPSSSGQTSVPQDIRRRYAVDLSVANKTLPHASILCPLPRIDEIATEVDDHPSAKYFFQSDQAQLMRMAVLESGLSRWALA